MAIRTPQTTHGASDGPAVDKDQNPVIDPSKNVLGLVASKASAAKHLRLADLAFNKAVREADQQRINDLREAEIHRVDDRSDLRAEFQEKLANAESRRIDAILDAAHVAVVTAASRQEQQAGTLASQVAASAETLRALVATTAASAAAQLQGISTQFSERLSALEKAQYESHGKAVVADPLMAEMITEIKNYTRQQQTQTGKSEGINAVWIVVVGAIGVLGIIIAIVDRLLK